MDLPLYITCFAGSEAPGLHAYRFDPESGALIHRCAIEEGLANPIYARTDSKGRFLYVADVTDDCDGEAGGSIVAFAIDRSSGALQVLNRRPAGGTVPCYLSMSADDRFVLVANFGSGTLSVFPVDSDGSLGDAVCTIAHEVPAGREVSAPHCIVLDAANRFALAADRDLDRIFVYAFDTATGQLVAHDPPYLATADGAGPRHIAFHPDGRRAYCLTENDNTVVAMDYDPDAGTISAFDTQPALPSGFDELNYGADIWNHPNGRFVYASNRGHNSIAMFEIEQSSRTVRSLGHESTQGEFPRGIAIDPTGGYLLVGNENSDSVVTFRIDAESGRLEPVGTPMNIVKPACFTFVPGDREGSEGA